MKTYRLKNNYYNGIKLYRKGVTVYKFDRDYHYSDNGDDDTFINSAIVENNPDIFELIEEPEPQGEVIEGYAWERQEGKYHFVKPDQPIIEGAIDSILILNPKKKKEKKEYVRWVMKEFTENLKKDDCPIYRVIATKSDNEKYCHKIKIIVEDE